MSGPRDGRASGGEPPEGVAADRRGGFTLMEVVVALGVLMLGIGSVLALFTSATAAHRRAIHHTQATEVAEWALADVESALRRGVELSEIVEEPPLEALRADWPGYRVEVSLVPIAGETGSDEILVRVGVIWQSAGRDARLDFQEIVARRSSLRR